MGTDLLRWRFFGATALAFALLLGGCATAPDPEVAEPLKAEDSVRLSPGYGLLYELVSKQGGVGALLAVRGVSGGTEELVGRVVKVCGWAKHRLEEAAAGVPGLGVDDLGLPAAEVAARASIEKEKSWQLLTAGNDFESRLLMTLVESMTYGSHLARELAGFETDAGRRAMLKEAADRMGKLRDEAYDRLLAVGSDG